MNTTHSATVSGTTRNPRYRSAHAMHGNYKGRTATKVETSCFTKFKNKLNDLFKATKRLANRAIKKIEDFLCKLETTLSESANEAYEKVKNIKTPFRKNYFHINLFGHTLDIGRQATVSDVINRK